MYLSASGSAPVAVDAAAQVALVVNILVEVAFAGVATPVDVVNAVGIDAGTS